MYRVYLFVYHHPDWACSSCTGTASWQQKTPKSFNRTKLKNNTIHAPCMGSWLYLQSWNNYIGTCQLRDFKLFTQCCHVPVTSARVPSPPHRSMLSPKICSSKLSGSPCGSTLLGGVGEVERGSIYTANGKKPIMGFGVPVNYSLIVGLPLMYILVHEVRALDWLSETCFNMHSLWVSLAEWHRKPNCHTNTLL